MSFFDSDIVRAEMTKISELQEELYGSVMKFPYMNKEERLDHVNLLKELLEKQKILYARLSLSDDPEAVEMKEKIYESALMMGLPSDVDMNVVFSRMAEMLAIMEKQLDKDSTDY